MGQVLLEATDRTEGALCCDGVPVAAVADAVGTPTYMYSASVVRDRYRLLERALEGVPHRIHYSLKANANRAILQVLRELGCAVDVVSGGELHRALAAGFPAAEIVFGGVGKTAAELREALVAGVKLLNVESEGELRLIDELAGTVGRQAPVALRVNPEITVENAHAYIKTGEKGHKFGIPYDDVAHIARLAHELPHVRLEGLDMHVGSQLSHLGPYEMGLERLVALHTQLVHESGIDTIRYLDVGGGLAVRYEAEVQPDVTRFGEIVRGAARRTGLEIILEPGRFFVGDAGVLLTRVLYRKRSGGKEYVITDAGMTELLRPSHYNAYHRIEAAEPRASRLTVDVVGPVCESGDFLALERELDDVAPGDLLLVHGAGAYGYVMASNYNARPRGAEVLADAGTFALVTARERYEDLTRLEVETPDWRKP